jgi:hypothetical protein
LVGSTSCPLAPPPAAALPARANSPATGGQRYNSHYCSETRPIHFQTSSVSCHRSNTASPPPVAPWTSSHGSVWRSAPAPAKSATRHQYSASGTVHASARKLRPSSPGTATTKSPSGSLSANWSRNGAAARSCFLDCGAMFSGWGRPKVTPRCLLSLLLRATLPTYFRCPTRHVQRQTHRVPHRAAPSSRRQPLSVHAGGQF